MSRYTCVPAVAFLLTVAVPGRAAAQSQNIIYACVNSNGANKGQVRIVPPTETCAKNETPMRWGTTGPTGPQGPQGPTGPSGALNLAGFVCLSGQSIVGFDASGSPICSASSGGGGGGGGGGIIDSDGDGIPDSVDPCPASANVFFPGGSACPADIYQVTTGLVNTGSMVYFANVLVTSVVGNSIVASIVPGDPNYNGAVIPPSLGSLAMDVGALPVPLLGSRINVAGIVVAGPGFVPAMILVVSTP